MPDKLQKHVFISYVRENSAQVQQLCNDLMKNGVNVWLDRNQICPGEKWKNSIRKAIREGNFFIACFSEEYNSRDKCYMNEELCLAIEELRQYADDRIWFIPVLFSECDIPAKSIGQGETILDINWVPLYEDWPKGIDRILSVIGPIPPYIQQLIMLYENDIFHNREEIVKHLGDTKNPTVVPTLIKALSDEYSSIRVAAASALGKIKDAAATQALEVAVEGNDYNVKEQALISLGGIRTSDSARIIGKGLEDRFQPIRLTAVQALSKISTPDAIPNLVKALKDTDEIVRFYAATAIGESIPFGAASWRKTKNSIVPTQALIATLNDPSSIVPSAAIKSLGKIGSPDSVPFLVDFLDDNYSDSWNAARALGMIGSSDAVSALLKRLQHKIPNIRSNAIEGLRIAGDKAAIPALLRLLDDEDDMVRLDVVGVLGNIGDFTIIPELKRVENDSYHRVRETAIFYINKLSSNMK
jgi:HEAT repeat protein